MSVVGEHVRPATVEVVGKAVVEVELVIVTTVVLVDVVVEAGLVVVVVEVFATFTVVVVDTAVVVVSSGLGETERLKFELTTSEVK